jgi:acid phosphatase
MFRVFSLAFFLSLCSFAQPFRFVAIGDTGSGSDSQKRVAEQMWRYMQDHPFQLVLMLGDNIYGNTELTGGGDPKFFHDKFDVEYQRFLEKGVVFHAVIGNHDLQHDGGRSEIEDRRRFGIEGSDAYYKFSGPDKLADFFALNSELSGEKERAQVEWFNAAVKKSEARWKFVFLHHPLYTIRGQRAPVIALRTAIDAAMKENHVQIALAGHNHMYVRFKPVDGRIQFVAGGGGRHLAFPRKDPCAEISARKYHFLAVDVYPDKVHFTAIDEFGNIFDDKVVDEAFLKTSAAGCPER